MRAAAAAAKPSCGEARRASQRACRVESSRDVMRACEFVLPDGKGKGGESGSDCCLVNGN